MPDNQNELKEILNNPYPFPKTTAEHEEMLSNGSEQTLEALG